MLSEQLITDGRRLSLIELLTELTKARAETRSDQSSSGPSTLASTFMSNLLSYTGKRSDQHPPQWVTLRRQYAAAMAMDAVCDALFADISLKGGGWIYLTEEGCWTSGGG